MKVSRHKCLEIKDCILAIFESSTLSRVPGTQEVVSSIHLLSELRTLLSYETLVTLLVAFNTEQLLLPPDGYEPLEYRSDFVTYTLRG